MRHRLRVFVGYTMNRRRDAATPKRPMSPQQQSAIPKSTSSSLDTRVLQACDAIGEFIEYWGFKGVYGRVWALLALSATPLTQIEIARRLQVSRSLVSMAMAELQDLGLIRPLTEARNSPYSAVIDVWPTISDILRSREWMLIEGARIKLEAALEETQLAEEAGRPHGYNAERMRFLLRMTEVAQTLLRILIAIRTPRSLVDVRDWATSVRQLFQHIRQLA